MFHDEYTGRYHTHYREYDPVHGRWLSEDPAGYLDGLNLYATYTGVNGTDPLGLAGYFFEGTRNHPYPTNLDGSQNYITNIRKLYLAYDQDVNGKAYYAYGIGTGYSADGTKYATAGPLGKADRKSRVRAEGVTGDTLDSRVSWMIQNLERELQSGDKNVDVYGFSRGSASELEFLNRIQDQINKGNPLYKDINIRFVGLFDAVSSVASRGFCSNDILTGRASNFRFSLPANMTFANQPVHTIALDERRGAFQQIDVRGALQVGFRGVHSDNGGGYPNNSFDWIVRDFMVEKSKAAGVVFNQKVLDSFVDTGRNSYETYLNHLNNYNQVLWYSYDVPTDNDTWYYNETDRIFPKDMVLHPSVRYFIIEPENSIEGFPYLQ